MGKIKNCCIYCGLFAIIYRIMHITLWNANNPLAALFVLLCLLIALFTEFNAWMKNQNIKVEITHERFLLSANTFKLDLMLIIAKSG
ncbi:MAG: hypothetical protein FWC71_02060 [Defluviitaleaceae bacterium]|nr:hypothetical protein [Defluviitaleaceae bacterium]